MRFANLNMLFLLVLPLVGMAFAIGGIWLRRRLISRLGDANVVEHQLRRPSPYLRAIKAILLVVGLVGLIVAAARPQYGGRTQMLKKRGIDIVVALDFSKSMLAQDVAPNRIERAKMELSQFVENLAGDRIGLVAFAGDTMSFPLTTDYTAATAFWKDLGPYDMPVGGTAIGKALNAALRLAFDGKDEEERGGAMDERSKVIVLLTDGEDHVGEPLEVSKSVAKAGVRIYTVGIGSDSPELIPRYLNDGTPMGYQKDSHGEYVTTSLSAENEDVLKQIAGNTGGRYYRALSDLKGLNDVIAEIRGMKQREIQSRTMVVYDEVYQWFIIPAFAFILLAYLLPVRRKEKSSATEGEVR